MLSSISSKLSLYDVLGILLPGFMVVSVIFILPKNIESVGKDIGFNAVPYWCKMALFLISTYIVGIVNSNFTTIIWSRFRNNIKEIVACESAIITCESAIIKGLKRERLINYSIILSWYLVITLATYFIIIGEYLLRVGISLICTFTYFRISFKKISYSSDRVLHEYYKKYYYVEKSRSVNGVKILEGQIALLQNICLPLCIWSAIIIVNKNLTLYSFLLTIWLIAILILLGTVFMRQGIVYRIILEDYKYLNELNDHIQ